MTTKHLTCKEFVERTSDFLGGGDALTPQERIELEQHLLVCPPCTIHLGQMRATIATTALLREPATTPSAGALDAFAKWKARS